MLEAGDRIPTAQAPRCGGGLLDLGSFAGEGALFFYPEASTEGCTKEAVEFNGLLDQWPLPDVETRF